MSTRERESRMTRQDPETFRLPVKKLREGYYSDAYFNHTKAIMEDQVAINGKPTKVVMQVFQKKDSYLAGIDEAIAILKMCSGRSLDGLSLEAKVRRAKRLGVPSENYIVAGEADVWVPGWDQLQVWALNEGDKISPMEPVMFITGPYHLFAHLETVYLGVLSRRTLIATNVREVLDAANGKPVLYFPARHDHWMVQTGDGYTAHVVGVQGVSTDAQASWWGGKGVGTVPHALIAAFGGDTVAAATAFADKYGDQLSVSVLVDFKNDSCETALAVADALGDRLWGVRLDTSESMVDKGLWDDMQLGEFSGEQLTGVNPRLVERVRRTLDDHGYCNVRILVSGGFDAAKIRKFEDLDVPVDAYGVGASLIRGQNAYTADIVRVNMQHCAKAGRRHILSGRLEWVA